MQYQKALGFIVGFFIFILLLFHSDQPSHCQNSHNIIAIWVINAHCITLYSFTQVLSALVLLWPFLQVNGNGDNWSNFSHTLLCSYVMPSPPLKCQRILDDS